MVKQKKEFAQNFERMIDTAELKALSNASLERPLTNDEFIKMQKLAKKVYNIKFKNPKIIKCSQGGSEYFGKTKKVK